MPLMTYSIILVEHKGDKEMTNEEKIAALEDLMDLDEGSLTEDTLLADVSEYDSMTKLSLAVMMEDDFGVKLDSDMIKGFKTVGDIIKLMVKD